MCRAEWGLDPQAVPPGTSRGTAGVVRILLLQNFQPGAERLLGG